MQKKDHYDDIGIDLSDEELKIMQEVEVGDEKVDKSGIEKKIKLLMNTPERFKEFEKTINNLVLVYGNFLEQFSSQYIAYKKNPDNNTYKSNFFFTINEMKQADASVSQITKSIQEETGKINDLVDSINQVLNIERTDNKLLKKEKKITQEEKYGSKEMIGDFVDDYKRIRLGNILLMTATIYLFLYFCYFMYKRWYP